MRNKLQKFTTLTDSLLPHETAYLLDVQQFQDPVRLDILKRVHHNAQFIDDFIPYDEEIDKRKYNHLQNWIQTRLAAVDVDEQYSWMLSLEKKIMTDEILWEDEKVLLKEIRHYDQPTFYFTRLYELAEQYRHFLHIRLRYDDYELVNHFLETHRNTYLSAKRIHQTLHRVTRDIVGQYASNSTDSKQWEEWLQQIFFNEEIEGHIRYLVLVRMTFICYNYRNFDALKPMFDYLDKQFSKGRFLSKRHLLNYYNNRLMLHSHYKEYDKAVYYGYLSVRAKTHDYVMYVKYLCAVLLRLERYEEALKLMQGAAQDVKKTHNFHSRIGFGAFFMEAMNKNQRYQQAENYGDMFIRAYQKEILQNRWHLFFSVYLEALIHQQKYEKLLKLSKRFDLQARDKEYTQTAGYMPSIPVYISLARFKEGLIHQEQLVEEHRSILQSFLKCPKRQPSIDALLVPIQHLLPYPLSHFQQEAV